MDNPSRFQNQEEFFQWLSETYHIPSDKLHLCIAKDFDFAKFDFTNDNNNDVLTTIEIENATATIDVPKELAPLMTILNRDVMVADDCNKMNYFGYSSIFFTLEGYYHWMTRLQQAVDSQCNSNLPIIKRFQWSLYDQTNLLFAKESTSNILSVGSQLQSGESNFRLGVFWQFLPSDIDEIVEQLKELNL